jgi:hypothetical protein
VGSAGKALWRSGAIDIYNVYSRGANGTNAQFYHWVIKGCQPPGNATEACRLASLGLFFGHAKNEIPGFSWQLLRRPGRPVMAELNLVNKDGNAIRWVIDAPRLDEEPTLEAELFIFPSHEDALQKAPAGKRYTWDLGIVGAGPDELRYAVKLKNSPGDPLTTH